MLNSPTLSIFQHFHAIPLRSPLTPSGSSPDGEPRGFDAFRHLSNTLLPPSGEVPKAMGACQRLSNNVGYTVVLPPQPFGQLPRWGAKRIRRFPSSLKHLASPFGGSAEGNGGMPAVIEQCWIHRSAAPSALRAAPPMGSQEDSALSVISQTPCFPLRGKCRRQWGHASGHRTMLDTP